MSSETSEDVTENVGIAQLNVHGYTHSGGTTGGAGGSTTKKLEKPLISHDMMEQEWAELKFLWEAYKKDTGISSKEDKIRSELQQCCKKAVRTRLFQKKR